MSKTSRRASYGDHASALKSLDLDQVIFVYGTSELLLSRALDRVRDLGAKAKLPYVAIEAQAVTESMIAQIGGQGSLFEPATLYLLRRVEQARALPRLLKALPGSGLANRLVFAYRGEGAPAPLKTELTRLKARHVPCFEPWPNEIPDVVQTLATSLKLKLKSDAVQLLIEMNGQDLVKHFHELTKLSLVLAGQEGPFGRAEVAPHVGLLREDDAFQLDKLLLARQWSKAHALAHALIARGERGLSILAILAGHCRGVLQITEAQSLGLTPAELASRVRLPPFILKTYLQHVRGVESRRYLEALVLCQGVDVQMKSAGIPEDLLIASVIDRLAAP